MVASRTYTFSRFLIVGGTGLVGQAVLRRAIPLSRKVFIVGLTEDEVRRTLSIVSKQTGEPIKREKHPILGEYLRTGKVSGFWGDIFMSVSMKDVRKGEMKIEENDPPEIKAKKREKRRKAIEDLLGLLKERKRGRQNYLRALLKYLKPDVVVDTVNTATAIAYRNIFGVINEAYALLKSDGETTDIEPDDKLETLEILIEDLLLTLNIPILLTHAMNLQRGLKEAGTKIYVKVGTTGTGGMGWNIPYTHGEDKPSKVLLDKSAIAGASTLLYVLMNRDDSHTVVKEIKPAAMIGWKAIGRGEIRKGGKPIALKMPIGVSLGAGEIPKVKEGDTKDTGEILETAYVDTGENGLFSLEEFRAITDLEQMEMVTPEDIAEVIFLEIMGKNTGKDVVGAVEGSIMGPSYRGGFIREDAIKLLEKYEKASPMPSVAFEILGPPRLSKLLFEAHVLKETFGKLSALAEASPEEISRKMWEKLKGDRKLMSYVTSVGIGVLSPDGKLYYTENLKVPEPPVHGFTEEEVEDWARKGWVDTREENARRWKYRAMMYLEELHRKHRELKRLSGASVHDRIGINPRNLNVDDRIIPGDIVRWIFIHEDKGRRTRPY